MKINGQHAPREIPVISPQDAARFKKVVDTIRTEGRPAGFAAARDVLLMGFETLRQAIPAPELLKLVIALDRHALFCEVSAERDKAAADAVIWDEYQKYLRGETDVAPTGQPLVGAANAVQTPDGGPSVSADLDLDDTTTLTEPEETTP